MQILEEVTSLSPGKSAFIASLILTGETKYSLNLEIKILIGDNGVKKLLEELNKWYKRWK